MASLEYEETTCKPMSIKEIYTATENLSPSNVIGQGIAGTCSQYLIHSYGIYTINQEKVYFSSKNTRLRNLTVQVYVVLYGVQLVHLVVPGKVYRGVLTNGWPVAVKHIVKNEHAETFLREVKSLSHVRHPNLVSLRGYCDGQEECFLVYELCINGNLSEWLFGE